MQIWLDSKEDPFVSGYTRRSVLTITDDGDIGMDPLPDVMIPHSDVALSGEPF
jgi:hypothetical protein